MVTMFRNILGSTGVSLPCQRIWSSPYIRSYSQGKGSELHGKDTLLASANRLDHESIEDLPQKDTVELSFRQYKPSRAFMPDPTLSPVVMLHGFLGSKQNYGTAGSRITQLTNHPTYGVDLRNHGDTPHAAPHDYYHLAKDVIRFLQDKKWKDVILAGHSMGAKTAMLIALSHPDLVSKLIVIDNSPVNEELDPSFRRQLLGMCQVEHAFPDFKTNKPQFQQSVIDEILGEYTNQDKKIQFFLKSNMNKKHIGNSTVFRVPVMNMLKEDVVEKMGQWPSEKVAGLQFTKPVLVMAAQHSNFVQEKFKPAFAQYFTDLTYEQFDCGHWIVTDKPHQFVQSTVEFINRQSN